MVSKVSTLNTVQKIPTQPIIGRVVLQPNTWYTCPAGKKAIIKGSAVSTGTGAAANTTLRGGAGPTTIRRVLAAGGATDPWQRDLAPNINFDFEIQLAAGEILETVQNAGTNAEWELDAKVQESPA